MRSPVGAVRFLRLLRLLRAAFALTFAAGLWALPAACARSESSDPIADPTFALPDTKNPAPLNACVATDCPKPWATCPGGGLCTTDTSRDVFHCGACDHACPRPPGSFHAKYVCSQSKCEMACDELSSDCNHDPADGCEVYTGDDPKNCGGCGQVCDEGEICWKGACGCPKGFVACGSECKDLSSDAQNCGACGVVCKAPPSSDPAWTCGADVQPPNTAWGCTTGACGLVCKPSFENCNANMCSDGCEINTRSDRLNCGACGHVCEAGQNCINGACLCPAGTTRCGNRCVDVNVDTDNCGECGNACPGASGDTANGNATCTGGRCGYTCYPGFADCDHLSENGCEINLGTDAKHCGSCGTKCDSALSQPCVLGQCLTKPCGPPPVTR